MAKVTLILEDTEDANGNSGLLVDFDAGDGDEDSVALGYATAFIQYLMSGAKESTIVDKDDPDQTPPEDSPLN